MIEKETLSVEEVAERLNISPATVRRRAKLLGGQKVALTGGWRFPASRVRAFAKASKRVPRRRPGPC